MKKYPHEAAYKIARDGVFAAKQNGCISNWMVVDELNNTVCYWKHPCHASQTSFRAALSAPPVVHGERFASWFAVGAAGQRYYTWLLGKKSVFAPWFDGGIEVIKNDSADEEIIGALWKNMQAPDYIVSQWFFAGRCPGEHFRAPTWDVLVQSGFNPIFAFWAMHTMSYNTREKTFFSQTLGHIGITSDNTLLRLMTKDPNLNSIRTPWVRRKAAPYIEGKTSGHHSNHIWLDDKVGGYIRMLPFTKVKSGFGDLSLPGYRLEGMKDGAKILEDKFEVSIL